MFLSLLLLLLLWLFLLLLSLQLRTMMEFKNKMNMFCWDSWVKLGCYIIWFIIGSLSDFCWCCDRDFSIVFNLQFEYGKLEIIFWCCFLFCFFDTGLQTWIRRPGRLCPELKLIKILMLFMPAISSDFFLHK